MSLRLTVTIVALAAALTVSLGTASPATPSQVVTRTSVGGYATSSGFGAAKKLFGAPYSETQGPKICIARWQGLTIAWQRTSQ